MEFNVLKVMNFNVGVPLSYQILHQYSAVRISLWLSHTSKPVLKHVNCHFKEFFYSYVFIQSPLVCFLQVAKLSLQTLTFAQYILELSLIDYSFVSESSSKLAAAALLLALKIKLLDGWTTTLQDYSGVTLVLSY
jgi:ABC-type proline/glycine betaine transport system permease subunit